MNRLAREVTRRHGASLVASTAPTTAIEAEHLRINAARWVRWLQS